MSCTKNIIFFDFSSFLILTISKFCVFYVYKEVADLVKTIFFNNRIFQIIKCYYLYRSLGYFLLFRKQHLNNILKNNSYLHETSCRDLKYPSRQINRFALFFSLP